MGDSIPRPRKPAHTAVVHSARPATGSTRRRRHATGSPTGRQREDSRSVRTPGVDRRSARPAGERRPARRPLGLVGFVALHGDPRRRSCRQERRRLGSGLDCGSRRPSPIQAVEVAVVHRPTRARGEDQGGQRPHARAPPRRRVAGPDPDQRQNGHACRQCHRAADMRKHGQRRGRSESRHPHRFNQAGRCRAEQAQAGGGGGMGERIGQICAGLRLESDWRREVQNQGRHRCPRRQRLAPHEQKQEQPGAGIGDGGDGAKQQDLITHQLPHPRRQHVEANRVGELPARRVRQEEEPALQHTREPGQVEAAIACRARRMNEDEQPDHGHDRGQGQGRQPRVGRRASPTRPSVAAASSTRAAAMAND